MKTIKDLKVINVKSFRGHDGMLGLNCDLVYKGVKLCHVYDDAWGGGYMYTDITDQKLFDELNAEIKKLPKEKSELFPDGLQPDLDIVVGGLADDAERLKKSQHKGIMIDMPNGKERLIYWTGMTIPQLVKHPDGLKALQKAYDENKNEGNIVNIEYLKTKGIRT